MARSKDWRSLGRYPETIRIRSRLGVRNVGVVLGSLLMAAACLWLAFSTNQPGYHRGNMSPFDRVFAFIGAIFFGCGVIVYLWWSARPGNGITLSPEGISDRTTMVSMGLVRWDEMVGVVPATTVGVGFVGIPVRDPEDVLQRSGDGLQKAKRANMHFGGLDTPVWISTETLSIDPASLAALINDYHEAWRLDHGTRPSDPPADDPHAL